MKRNTYSDKITKISKLVLIILFLGLTVYLLEFFVRKIDIDSTRSPVPTLEVSKIENISNKLKSRTDVETNGKPDIDNFNFGNIEPF